MIIRVGFCVVWEVDEMGRRGREGRGEGDGRDVEHKE